MTTAPTDPNAPLPTEYVLESDPSVHVANVELGVTFYLQDAMHWAQRGGVQALQKFISLAPQDYLLWYTTSRLDHFKRVRKNTLHEVVDAFSVDWLGTLRHGFELVLADDTGSEATGFRYVEIDEKRANRTALLELTIPAHFDPATLRAMADAVFELGPVWCGIGGFALRHNALHRTSAFGAAHGWAKRYLGMDIQDRDAMPWLVKGKVPGVSWLNYFGPAWLEAAQLDPSSVTGHTFQNEIHAQHDPRGLRIVAGDTPAIADLNRFQRPTAYEELARMLAPHFIAEPPLLYGDFLRDQDAQAWFRRHVEPDGWA